MELSSSSRVAPVPADYFPSLGLSDECKHVLKDVYKTIQKEKGNIENLQSKIEGARAYAKIGVKHPDEVPKLWVHMQVIAPEKKLAQSWNNLTGGLWNISSHVFSDVEVTDPIHTHRALHTAADKMIGEIQTKFQDWSKKTHDAQDQHRMIGEIDAVADELLSVVLVVGTVTGTYEREKADDKEIQPIRVEAQRLHDFVTSFLLARKEELLSAMQPTLVEQKGEQIHALVFTDAGKASRWFAGQKRIAQENAKTNPSQVSGFADMKKMVGKALKADPMDSLPQSFVNFASKIDIEFLKVYKQPDLKSYVQDVVKQLRTRGVSADVINKIEHAESFSYLLKVLAAYGKEEDFRALFGVLVNSTGDGPADLTRAPLILNEIFRSVAFYNLFAGSAPVEKK